MMAAAEVGLEEISNQTHQPSGMLRVTVPAVLTQSKLIDRMAGFADEFPNVQLSLDFSDLRRELIGDGFDIAIRMGWLKDSSLKTRKLFEVQRRLVAAPRYLKSRPEPASPQDLDDWDWLELAPVRHKKPEFRNGAKCVVISRRESRISANNAQALHRLTRLGAGLAILPDFLSEADLANRELSVVLPNWSVEPVGVYAVWPSNAPKDGLVKRFIEFLVTES